MAANPPLCSWQGQSWPQPYAGEQILLSRGGVQLDLRGPALRTRGNKCVAVAAFGRGPRWRLCGAGWPGLAALPSRFCCSVCLGQTLATTAAPAPPPGGLRAAPSF